MEGIQLSLSTLIPHYLGIHHLVLGAPSRSSSPLPHSYGAASSFPHHHIITEADAHRNAAAATDVLVPSFDSEKRKLSRLPATLSLAATLTGPGLTMIPSLFDSCGIVSTTVVLLLTAWLTDRSLYLTCLCARRGGVATLVEVGQVALGAQKGVANAALVAVFAMFVLLVELVMLTNAWTPAVQVVRQGTSDWMVSLVILVVLLPFLTCRELLSLHRNYYLWSVASVLTIGTMAYLAFDQERTVESAPTMQFTQNEELNIHGKETMVEYSPSLSFICIATSLPTAAMAFGCGILNILPIQSSLREPTAERMQSVIRAGVGLSFAITYAFGVTGYIYADGRLQSSNVLRNITSALTSNGAAYLAAVMYGMMIFLALPLAVMPCRRAILEFIDKAWFDQNPHAFQSCREHCPEACEECCDEDPDEQTCMTFPSLSSWSVTTPGSRSADVLIVNEGTQLLPVISEEAIRRCNLQNNLLLHAVTTLVILAFCFAISAFGAASEIILTAWHDVGSTAVWIISYALPAACFTQIQDRDPTFPYRCGWTSFSWFLLVIATTGSLCSLVTTVTNTKMA